MKDSVKINNDTLNEFLAGDIGDFIKSTKSVDNNIHELKMSTQAGLPTPAALATSIEGFLEQGQSVLETMTVYCNNMPDAESVNALASLINAMTSSISKIATLYKTEQAHQNKLELEERKHEFKMKEIEFKENMKMKRGEDPGEVLGENVEETVPVNTAEIVNQIMNAKKIK